MSVARRGGGIGAACLAAAAGFAAWMVWGLIAYAGPFRWIAEWELARFGTYSPGLIAVVPIMLVSVPLAATAALVGLPAVGAKVPLVIGLVGLILLALGGRSLARAVRHPSLDDPPRTVDLARIGGELPPAGHVRLVGRADNARAVAIRWRGKTSDHERVFTPLRPAGDRTAPVRYVVLRDRLDPIGPPPTEADDPEGLLAPDALPGDGRAAFARAGVPLAAAVHVLDPTGVGSMVTDYAVGAALVLAALACFGLLLAGRRAPARPG